MVRLGWGTDDWLKFIAVLCFTVLVGVGGVYYGTTRAKHSIVYEPVEVEKQIVVEKPVIIQNDTLSKNEINEAFETVELMIKRTERHKNIVGELD